MKATFAAIIVVLSLTACGHKETRVDEVRFAPPAAAYDKELEVADPGEKSQKGDPNASVVMSEAMGNAGVDRKGYKGVTSASMQAGRITDTTKKIIKEGDISFETDDIANTRKRILLVLKHLDGYVYDDSQSLNSEENRKEYTLKIRIPAKGFDIFLDSVASGAKQIDTKNIRVQDVTTQFIDISTRLDHKKLLEARYLQLLKQASKMADILEVENKLNEIRTDIESTQGQLNYLSKQVAYSSLDITFYSKAKKADKVSPGFTSRFSNATDSGWKFVQRMFFDVIACWPLIMILALLYLLVVRNRRMRLDRKIETE